MKQILGNLIIYINNFILSSIPFFLVRNLFYRRIMNYDISPKASIHLNCHFTCKSNFSIGDFSTINQACWLDNRGGINIGDNVNISPQVMIITAGHDIQSPEFSGYTKEVIIHDYAFIGSRATIMSGVIIGKGAVIAAGALVTKSIPAFEIWVGVPAKKIGDRNKDLNYSYRYDRLFH